MSKKRVSGRHWPGLVAYLDQRLGSHIGHEPELQWFCPFCIDRLGDESDARKLRVNTVKGVAICFRCGFEGNLRTMFMELNGGYIRLVEHALLKGEMRVEWAESLRATVLKILYATPDGAADELKPVPLPDDAEHLTRCQTGVYARGFNYFTKIRGIPPRFLELFDVRYCVGGRYAQRLIFPVVMNGQYVYFTSRYCGKHKLKSLNPKNEDGHFTKEHTLMNFDRAVGAKVVALVEGPFDCMAHKDAVAMFGKKPSAAQVALLETLVDYGLEEVVVSLDPDASKEMDDTVRRLYGRVPKVTALPLAYGDPDERRDELPELMEQRRDLTVADRVRQRLRRLAKNAV